MQARSRRDASSPSQKLDRTHDQVLAISRQPITAARDPRVITAEAAALTGRPPRTEMNLANGISVEVQRVEQADGRHERFDLMVAVLTPLKYFQEQIKLRGCPNHNLGTTSTDMHP
jgi:hypothetical protein